MKKLAVFVEGLTERSFVETLLERIAGAKRLRIETRQAIGDKWVLIKGSDPHIASDFFVLLVDCSSDNRVKSEIRENYDGLVREGYQAIIGLRDAYPDVTLDQLPQLRMGLQMYIKTKPIQVAFVIGVMEVEAWFLSEHTHFPKIHPDLTLDRIKTATKFDPSKDDMQLRPHPAGDLNDIYHLVGLGYGKKGKQVQRTVAALDYERVYLELTEKFPDLELLTASIDQFLSPQ